MKFKFKHALLAFAAFAMAGGVTAGAAVLGQEEAVVARAGDTILYTLDGSVTGGSNGYATESVFDINSKNWSITGNTTMNPWRIGGKNLSGDSRLVKSNAAISSTDVTRVDLKVGAASSVTVNSLKLYVGTEAGAKDVSEVSAAFEASSTISFNKPEGKNWSNRYFTFDFNLTIGGSNKFIEFIKADFINSTVAVTGVTLDKTETALTVGGTTTLTATVAPSGATNKNVTWSSGNEAVATVDGGVVTAVAPGSATITVTTEDGSKTATCAVTVSYATATGINFPRADENIAMNKGDTLDLTASVTPANADQTVMWESSDTNVATVELDTGHVEAVGVGATTITVYDSSMAYSASCTVTVTSTAALSLNETALAGYTGDSTILEANAQNFGGPVTYTWTADPAEKVALDANDELCEVDYLAAGSVTVTVSATDGIMAEPLTASCTITITQSEVSAVSIACSLGENPTIYDSDAAFTLTPTVTKVGTASDVVNWTNSNEEAVSISTASSQSGVAINVTPLAAGAVTITASSAEDPAVQATFVFTVLHNGLNLTWENKVLEYFVGDTFSLAEDSLQYFYDKTSSEKTSLAVSSEGLTAKLGEDDITLSTYEFVAADNGKTIRLTYTDGLQSAYVEGQLTVKKWRSVKAQAEENYSFNLTGLTTDDGEDPDAGVTRCFDTSGGLSAPAVSFGNYTKAENGYLRLGSGGNTGSVTFTFASTLVSKVIVNTRSHGSDSDVVLSVNGQAEELTSTAADVVYNLSTAANAITISTNTNGKRAWLYSVSLIANVEAEIGKTADCLGLETFIDQKLAMDSETKGQCNTLYAPAKEAFAALNDHQKALFVGNSAYSAEYARLKAWAAAKGEAYDSESGTFKAMSNGFTINGARSEIYLALGALLGVGAIATGGMIFIAKKKKRA